MSYKYLYKFFGGGGRKNMVTQGAKIVNTALDVALYFYRIIRTMVCITLTKNLALFPL